MLNEFNKAKEIISKLSDGHASRVCVFCTGQYGQQTFQMLRLLMIKVDCVADNNPKLWGAGFNGLTCLSPQELAIQKDDTLVIVANKQPDNIVSELEAQGFPYITTKQKIGEMTDDILEKITNEYGPCLVKYMALTNRGTDASLENGCIPVQVHYNQPIPDLKELARRKVWDKVSELRGLNWQPERFVKNMRDLAEYSEECKWPLNETDDPTQYYLLNGSFGYGCATFAHSIIRKRKPKRIIEIGSGNSSKLMASTILKNEEDGVRFDSYTIIDPHTKLDISKFPENTKLIKTPVEELPLDTFASLEDGDILFIDSSHMCRIGGDVNFEILEVLPSLKSGVLVHFHDIHLPYEYSEYYARVPHIFWTEAYLLQAFLAFNSGFEILAPVAWLQGEKAALFRELFPYGNIENVDVWYEWWHSGSFWIRRL